MGPTPRTPTRTARQRREVSAGSPARPPAPRVLSQHPFPSFRVFPPPAGPNALAAGLGGDPGERSCRVGVGRGARGATVSCKMGDPGCKRRWKDRDPWGEPREEVSGQKNMWSLAPCRAGTSPTSLPSSLQGLGVGEGRRPPDSLWDLSLNAAVEAGVRCRG